MCLTPSAPLIHSRPRHPAFREPAVQPSAAGILVSALPALVPSGPRVLPSVPSQLSGLPLLPPLSSASPPCQPVNLPTCQLVIRSDQPSLWASRPLTCIAVSLAHVSPLGTSCPRVPSSVFTSLKTEHAPQSSSRPRPAAPASVRPGISSKIGASVPAIPGRPTDKGRGSEIPG